MLILVAYGKDHQVICQIVHIMLNGAIICGDGVLTVEQKAHDEVLAAEDAKVGDGAYFGEIRVRTVLQYQLEQHVKGVRLVLLLLDDGFGVAVFVLRALIVAILADFRRVTLIHPQIVLVKGIRTVYELHLIGLNCPDHHFLIDLHVIECDNAAGAGSLLQVEGDAQQVGAERYANFGFQVAFEVLEFL